MMVFEESGKLRVTREKSLGADQQASSVSVAAPGLNTGHIDETWLALSALMSTYKFSRLISIGVLKELVFSVNTIFPLMVILFSLIAYVLILLEV